ncbi:IS4 family transposase [Luteolibacter sp. Populi]|uniref:IS4 family transposase n=1 Tax=Luteolibacter sp. Populi TaxID=3230487 RepID=UPI003466D78B
MHDAPHPRFPFHGSFPRAFAALLDPPACDSLFERRGPRGGPDPKLSPWQWLMTRTYHQLAPAGSFSTHVKEITGIRISGSALSQRGKAIGWELLHEALHLALRPLADPALHPGAFHRGLRLLAIDGTTFNLRNTPAIAERAVKVPCGKGNGQPAFARMLAVVLVELGMYQPLAAAPGWQGEGEATLARRILQERELPEKSLLLGDRLYGTPSLLWHFKPALEKGGGAFLMRVKSNLKATVKEHLSDGSRRIVVKVTDPATRRVACTLELREILATVTVAGGGKPLQLRLWTSLMDETLHPAAELVELYAARWQHELFFRELKVKLHGRGDLLDAQTPETAAQEVLALLMAAAVLALQRAAVAEAAGVEVPRISFAVVRDYTAAMCKLLELGNDLMELPKRAIWVARALKQLAEVALIPWRKPRSCQRALRQPVKDWPKMKQPSSLPLLKSITINPASP